MTNHLKLISLLTAILFALPAWSVRYVGGDISLLPEYEKAKAVYRDNAGKTITEVLPWFKSQGMNAMRVRLFVNPKDYKGSDADPNACQDLEYIVPLCKRIKDAGFALLLDFHYSDFWADPGKQWTPEIWRDKTDDELNTLIYEYTRDVLTRLVAEGATPDLIQPGNEISYGMMWGPQGTATSQLKKTVTEANWTRFGNLLSNAIRGCREVCPNAKIIIHNERIPNQNVLLNFYTRMRTMKIDYDIIGLSFYPYFHGDIPVLDGVLTNLETRYPEHEIMIVETGYPYKWEVGGSKFDLTSKYPYSDAGQESYTKDLVATLQSHKNVTGLFWWWMEYNAYKTSLSGWYNAPLFDSLTGKAGKALQAMCAFGDNSGLGVTYAVSDPYQGIDVWYDTMGRRIAQPSAPGLYIHNGAKVLITQ